MSLLFTVKEEKKKKTPFTPPLGAHPKTKCYLTLKINSKHLEGEAHSIGSLIFFSFD